MLGIPGAGEPGTVTRLHFQSRADPARSPEATTGATSRRFLYFLLQFRLPERICSEFIAVCGPRSAACQMRLVPISRLC
jgi:hypothetical protein